MSTKYAAQLVCALSVTLGFAAQARAQGPEVAVCTDLGSLTVELDDELAPLHAANFLEYVDQGYYSGTVFTASSRVS